MLQERERDLCYYERIQMCVYTTKCAHILRICEGCQLIMRCNKVREDDDERVIKGMTNQRSC